VRHVTVLFDLDGTLIDSGPIILRSMRHATRTVLGRVIADDVLMAGVGGGGLHEQMRVLDAARAEELVRVYVEHNVPLHDEVTAFDGIERALAAIRARGVRTGVVTAKRRATVEHALVLIPIGRYFDIVVTADDTERHKPDPEPLLLALRGVAHDGGPAAYVGDSPFDVRAARAAGITAIACTWGAVHPRERVEAERPDALIERPEDLLDVL
jgi:pyrophosphatase PpaX